MKQGTWVLFDLDGTLTQSEEGICNSARYAAERMNLPVPDGDTLRKFIGPPLVWSFQEYLGLDPEAALRAQEVYRERYNTVGLFENRVYPGIRYVLRMLKKAGIHTGVVTGKPEGPTGRILEHFGLRKWMETVVCAADNKAEKELLIRKALPEDAAEAWIVGDRKFDMEGGVKAGIHTLGVTYGYGSEEELVSSGAERIAHTPREIAEILCSGTEPVRGAFLSMEGPDGSGKGTQLERLADTLDRYGFEVYRTREPGGSPIGEKIREILLDRENAAMTDVTEALLYAAARAQHVREVIRPQTAAGRVVLCDRYLDSSAAYQGGGRMLGVEQVLAINAPAVDGTLPDLTVYLDIDHRKAMARRCAATEPDRLETEPESFHARVEDGYHQLIEQDPERFAVVNAEGDRDAIAAEIAGKVLARLTEAED
ncbi:dTMP kinase [Clostridiales bacterium]|nr:dTMP kinase [Clostridiales bacterium]